MITKREMPQGNGMHITKMLSYEHNEGFNIIIKDNRKNRMAMTLTKKEALELADLINDTYAIR